MKKLSVKQRRIWWRLTVAAAGFIVALTLSPLVLSPGKTDPRLLHMPYSLWISLLLSVTMIILTWAGGKLHLQDRDNDDHT